ncbi:MAG: hypothetical protein WBQ78_13200 [Gammaproteobacteria bacterium]
MNVFNIHERALDATPEQVGALPDSLTSPAEPAVSLAHLAAHGRTWPTTVKRVQRRQQPGPIRYIVEAYTPGRSIRREH